jgi:hypothetical protein
MSDINLGLATSRDGHHTVLPFIPIGFLQALNWAVRDFAAGPLHRVRKLKERRYRYVQ